MEFDQKNVHVLAALCVVSINVSAFKLWKIVRALQESHELQDKRVAYMINMINKNGGVKDEFDKVALTELKIELGPKK